MTLLYYDLRIRKEGYDIELMAQQIGGGGGGTAGGSGTSTPTTPSLPEPQRPPRQPAF